ncbi:MAG TPA: HAMP domain-containing sensor histidine kinase, partial [Ramlibacter sp.]|nr:HAMP domain-containing sensor histidine kinase [Ramlibacter sp.]
MEATPLPGADQLYDAAPCGLLLAGSDGIIRHANATLCGWLHCKPADLVGQRRFHELLTMGGRIFYQTHLQPLLRMQASVAEVKLELKRDDGQPLPVMVNIAERAWQGETLLHVAIFVAEDRHKYERELLLQRRRAEDLFTQHLRDQEDLQAARAQAEDRAQFAEQMVGVVSHDIRNPLSVIHMSALLLERGLGAEQQKAAVARVSRAVQRAQHLIGDLLDFTQARLGGGIAVRRTEVDLHQAIGDSVAELAVAFPQCPLRHERSGDGRMRADADRIVQAVGNLVANAVAHGDAGGAVTVRT